MQKFLNSFKLVDIENVKSTALGITKNSQNSLESAKLLYHFVRDNIDHSADINENRITRFASEVLQHKHGICFAKSILLVALLRASNIPAGFGYQKLILDDEKYPWLVLHGYVFAYIDSLSKWVKLDARGNKAGVDAQFSTAEPKLAFAIRPERGEVDENINHSYILTNVESYLMTCKSRENWQNSLPRDFK